MTKDINYQLLMDVWNYDFDKMQECLAAGADVNAQDPEDGMTSVHHAVGRYSESMLAVLLSTGKADLQIRDWQGRTPLDHAFADAALVHDETKSIIKMLESYQNGSFVPPQP